jgi:type I restriction enzyme S subunit
MGSEWRDYVVEEIAKPVENAMATGPFGSAISSSLFRAEGVPVIRGSNLSQDISERLNDDEIVFVSNDNAEKFRRSIARKGDLIFTCWGTINQVGLIDDRARYKEYVISNKQMKLTPNDELVSSLFLYYVFQSPEKQDEILSNNIGSSVPGFNLGQLKKHKISLPPLPEQKAIAHILGTLDDKIELNHKMNETLEAMAQAIFKSWFVDFDPVRAKMAVLENGGTKEEAERAAMMAISGKDEAGLDCFKQENSEAFAELAHTAALFPSAMQDSELGLIPEGWEVSSVGEEFKIIMGQSPKGETYNEFGNGTLFFQGRAEFSWRFPSLRLYTTDPKRMAEAGDTLMSVRAPVGDVNIALNDCCVGRGLCAVRHISGCESYTYYQFLDLEKVLDSYNGEGTVFGSINQKDLKNIQVIKASKKVVNLFSTAVSGFDREVKNRSLENFSLTETRNTLLPKLLSGEIVQSTFDDCEGVNE